MDARKIILTSILLTFSWPVLANEGLDTQAKKFSYSSGFFSIRGIKQFIDNEPDFNKDIFLKGVTDALSNSKSTLSENEMITILQDAQKRVTAKLEEEKKVLAVANEKKGSEFRTNYSKEKDVLKTESGLAYKVISKGEGDSPAKEDTVVVHYSGKLIDGTEFDSSIKRGEPATFPLANVIPGWTEIVQLMKPGAKYEVVIPPQLAYGEFGAGQQIGPNSTLIFDIELLEVK